MIVCPVCYEEPADVQGVYGVLPGRNCKSRRSQNSIPVGTVEMVGDSIKNERVEFASSIVQPRNRYGELSKEYLEAHGTKGIKTTPEEVKNAKYIWDKAISRNINIKKSK